VSEGEGVSSRDDATGFEHRWTRAEIVPAASVLVVVDMVNHQVTPGMGLLQDFEHGGIDCSYLIKRVRSTVIPNTARLLEGFRQQQGHVAFLRVGAVAGHAGDGLPAIQESLARWDAYDGTWACEVVPELAPHPGELSLLKLGSGGFTTSNLDQHLRHLGVKSVFYTGVISNVCVLLTMAAGFDLGYDGYMVTDATATMSSELQETTEGLVGVFMAQTVSTDEALRLIAGDHRGA
jgi:nicotinamidase-related amidase